MQSTLYYLKLYMRFIQLILKARTQFKFSFITEIFVNMIFPISFFSVISFIVFRLGSLDIWSVEEMILMFGIGLLSWGITNLFLYTPLMEMESSVNTGKFDLYLYKPLHPLVLMIFSNFQHTYLGHSIVGAGLIVYSLMNLPQVDIVLVLKLLYFVFNAVLLHAGIIIFFLCLFFYIRKPLALVLIFVWDLQIMSRYPMEIFNKGIQLVFLIVPYVFISYYPVSILMNYDVHPVLVWINCIIGPVILIASVFTFNKSIVKYDSTGN
ncbi:ABC transporter permease [Paenibacillus sp. GCM10027627]|uniref:ABC transporter permease n=1 Tax=unclassified Paenibacillus TaxID=185978 RepID=UPI003632F98A